MRTPWSPNKRLETLIRQADYIVMENYTDGPPAVTPPAYYFAKEKQNYRGVKYLDACLRPKFGDALERVMSRLEDLRPYFAAQAIGEIQGQQTKSVVYPGIDEVIVRITKKNSKPILSLEKTASVIAALDSATHQEELSFVEGAARLCVDPEANKAFGEALAEQQRQIASGTYAGVVAQQARMEQIFGSDVAYRKIIAPRDAPLAEELMHIVKPGKTYLVALGALHVGGDAGVPAQLTSHGYTVSPAVD
jgi:uncharacterized protein YbaP (TraB family)